MAICRNHDATAHTQCTRSTNSSANMFMARARFSKNGSVKFWRESQDGLWGSSLMPRVHSSAGVAKHMLNVNHRAVWMADRQGSSFAEADRTSCSVTDKKRDSPAPHSSCVSAPLGPGAQAQAQARARTQGSTDEQLQCDGEDGSSGAPWRLKLSRAPRAKRDRYSRRKTRLRRVSLPFHSTAQEVSDEKFRERTPPSVFLPPPRLCRLRCHVQHRIAQSVLTIDSLMNCSSTSGGSGVPENGRETVQKHAETTV